MALKSLNEAYALAQLIDTCHDAPYDPGCKAPVSPIGPSRLTVTMDGTVIRAGVEVAVQCDEALALKVSLSNADGKPVTQGTILGTLRGVSLPIGPFEFSRLTNQEGIAVMTAPTPPKYVLDLLQSSFPLTFLVTLEFDRTSAAGASNNVEFPVILTCSV